MNRFTRLSAAAAGALALPASLILAAPAANAANAGPEVDREGRYAGAHYEFSVDREGRGYEVSVDVDFAKPGSKWKVVLWHDGKRFVKTTRTADREGDVELERFRPNTAGSDTFKVKITKVGSKKSVVRTIRFR
ncbi:hypothetical protein ACLM5J_19450 [Nocardioides sp. Bht2]|uniref:hypothetical protein n=1 Tax=Nocardioides sp. Bht2 TaxID=3392297 RepID=UPI0039B5C594